MRRLFSIVLLLALMAGFAFGVNRYLAARQTKVAAATTPTQTRASFVLPGTLYLAAGGEIYRLNDGSFTDLHLPSNLGTWMQPAIVPGTQNILAIARTAAYSELYLVSGDGQILQELSHNRTTSSTIQLNHWMFWPRVAADGRTVYVSYDAPKSPQSYEIEFAIWKGALGGTLTAKQWTTPFSYTGGDTEVTPLAGGDLLYAKYEISGGSVFSRIALQTAPLIAPVYLTDATEDCAQPAVSPGGTMVAMVCTNGTGLQSTSLDVAPLQGTTLGTPQVLVANCLCSAPAWAPDGSGLAYLAPADATGHFQLWWIAGAGTAAAKAPRQVTTQLDFDATSPPAWTS